MKKLLFATAVMSFAAGDVHADWKFTRWGMDESEFLREARKQSSVSNIETGTYGQRQFQYNDNGVVRLYFAEFDANRKLIRIKTGLQEFSTGVCRKDLAFGWYGQPHKEDGEQYIWIVSNKDKISLDKIWCNITYTEK